MVCSALPEQKGSLSQDCSSKAIYFHPKIAFVMRVFGSVETLEIKIETSNSNSKIYRNPRNKLVDINESVPDYSLFDSRRFYRPMGGKIFKTIPIEKLIVNSPQQSAFKIIELFEGANYELLDCVALNAGLGLYISGQSKDIKSGIEISKNNIKNGNAAKLINNLSENF